MHITYAEYFHYLMHLHDKDMSAIILFISLYHQRLWTLPQYNYIEILRMEDIHIENRNSI